MKGVFKCLANKWSDSFKLFNFHTFILTYLNHEQLLRVYLNQIKNFFVIVEQITWS